MDPKLEKEMIKRAKYDAEKTDDLVERLRLLCLARGVSGIKRFGKTFKIFDDDGSGTLDFNEFRKGINDYGLHIEAADTKALFEQFDHDGSGKISFDEFLTKLRPPMTRVRRELIEQAYQKLDKTEDGYITVKDLVAEYDVRHHPQFANGDMSKKEVYQHFLSSFEAPESTDGTVTFEEFFDYYAGVSASIDDDAYFGAMMCRAWNL